MPRKERDRKKAFVKTLLIPLVIITAAAAAIWFWVTPAPDITTPPAAPKATETENKQAVAKKTPPAALKKVESKKPKEALPAPEKKVAPIQPLEKAPVQGSAQESMPESLKKSETITETEKAIPQEPSVGLPPVALKTENKLPPPVQSKPPKRLKITPQEIFNTQGSKPQALSTPEDDTAPPPQEEPKRVRIRVKHPPVIDYNKLDQDQHLRALIDKRKEAFGIEKGVDLIVKSNESLKVGDITVPMQEILDKIHLKEGDIIEKDIPKDARMAIPKQIQPDSSKVLQTEASTDKGVIIPKDVATTVPKRVQPDTSKALPTEASGDKKAIAQKAGPALLESDIKTKIHAKQSDSRPATILGQKVFGIHVVRRGENIWNLHFQILRDYFARRDLPVSIHADEPISNGSSTGIGKLLKFSENLVYIYNLRERRLTTDLNLIQPLEKIVIYNMARVLELLDQIDFSNIDHIQFDGEVIWIPTEN
ncbi:MAG: hypothetical protein H8D61_01600 [Deltaproteobacteria bacterium]|nr:hypothetical protein [Deltaproteobacteria bacterium]